MDASIISNIKLRKSKLEQALKILTSQINELNTQKRQLTIQMHRIEGGIAELTNLLQNLENEPLKPETRKIATQQIEASS